MNYKKRADFEETKSRFHEKMNVLDYYSKKCNRNSVDDFVVEFRPTLMKRQWNLNPDRLWPEDKWTKIKELEVSSYM